MKKVLTILLIFVGFTLLSLAAEAQCSICTRTAEQLGEEPAKGLNAGIIYLAATPLVMAAIFGYKWWKNEKNSI